PAEPPPPPRVVEARLAEVLAASGQFNLDPFFGGTNLGFSGGRDPALADGFYCTSYDCAAPLAETGLPGQTYHAVRRVCTFASRFSRLLTSLEPSRQAVSLLPTEGGRASQPAVIHVTGSQGSIAFVFAGAEPAQGSKRE